MKKIFILILIIIIIISIYQFTYAYEVNGYNFGENAPKTELAYFYAVKGNLGYIVSNYNDDPYDTPLFYYDSITGDMDIRKAKVKEIDLTNGNLIRQWNDIVSGIVIINRDEIIASNYDVTINDLVLHSADFTNINVYRNNDKITLTNNSNTIMKSTLKGTLSANTGGMITYVVTDENGRFERQYDKVTDTLEVEIENLLPGETKNIYIQFPSDILRTKTFTIDIFENTYFTFEKYVPNFEIIGKKFYNLNTVNLTDEPPYIKPLNAKTLLLIKDGSLTYPQVIDRGEKFGIPYGKNLIVQFQHPSNSSILIESNINITESEIGFNPLNPEVLESYIEEVYGDGTIPYISNKDKLEISTPNKAVKITRLGNDIITRSLEVYTTATNETNGKIEWFAEVGGEISKIRDRSISSNFAGLKKSVLIMQGEYVIFSNTTGNIHITIPAMWRENIDYSVEYIENYETDSQLEAEYRADNPTMPDLASTNDIYTRTVDNSMYDWIQGNTPANGDLTIPNISNIGQQITSFTDMFLTPIKNLFTAMPEIYSLIIFAFGVSIVMFVLGR